MQYLKRIRNLFQRKYYMPAVSVVFASLMIYAFVIYIRNFEWIDLPQNRKWSEIQQSDTLRVVSIRTSFTAFDYRDHWYGYEYDLIDRAADSLGLVLDLIEVETEQELIDTLFAGGADLSIWPMSKSVIDQYWYLRPTGPRWEDSQIIATMRKLKAIPANDTISHYRIAIAENSRQWHVFNNDSVRQAYDLSHFVIDTVMSRTMTSEEMAEEMISGKTEAVMLRSNVARLLKSYYPTMQLSDTLPNSVDQVSWVAITGADTLRAKIDSVMDIIKPDVKTPFYSITHKRLFQKSKGRHARRYNFRLSDGQLSPYDTIFKRAAEPINWDWRLLAAIAYIESKFDHTQISSRGPIGLMQLMPGTVCNLGYNEEEVIDPSINVSVATSLIDRIQRGLRNKLPEASTQELIYYTIAAYNIGPGHIYDAINLAEELGYNPNIWYNNVEQCLRLKSDPKYYGLPVVKLGPCNGNFTINYLQEVLDTYEGFCKVVKK